MVRILSALALVATAVAAFNPLVKQHFNIEDYIHGGNTEGLEAAAPEEWFETQKLDHTDAANSAVWKQRFFTNDEFYGGAGSPVFVYINGENVARNTTVGSTGLFMNVLAKKHKALIVSLEHRYYGKSQPVADYTTANLKYLTAEQALNDLANFQDHLIAKRKLVDSKWVAFGGSYPGMLAAWAKSKHPTRFVGSVASSGPILAKADYHEYGDVVAFGLQYYGKEQCVNTVKTALTAFDKLVASTKAEDVAELNRLFKPCAPIKNDLDRATIESVVFGNFQNLAQSNDYAASNLKTACDGFNKDDGKSPLEKLAAFNALTYDTCTDSDYVNAIIKPLSNTAVTTTAIDRQWTYQTCAEFGFGQTTSTATSIFSALTYANPDAVLYEMCKQAFGITKAQTDVSIAATNTKYGALKIDVENVIFTNGNIDPWSALALTTKPVNPKSDFVFIDGTSHCRDMTARKPTDSASLNAAHDQIEAFVDGLFRTKC
ncbi:Aste57867_2778 [Aphanomyces stellatus]|uniref:Aste57867_2778 protein n=1 Tax=Aphanomyces stellatus TaxID=120398 RepID=A0A485K905_9STRA|nr:hypothetical protein As57867_002771 [Aphanomyces stellatus]VFT79968.1 Aste57867_2778 [Aphanomyces stellatus]